ncbi:hypothetical protein RJT34_30356 [Clitoria ternatea]|uniref:Uncharacterized protein n=1 Tax=Clitoria ternatea TaxID=43366 RepID=A0AAN9ESX5_CLITE
MKSQPQFFGNHSDLRVTGQIVMLPRRTLLELEVIWCHKLKLVFDFMTCHSFSTTRNQPVFSLTSLKIYSSINARASEYVASSSFWKPTQIRLTHKVAIFVSFTDRVYQFFFPFLKIIIVLLQSVSETPHLILVSIKLSVPL